MIRADDYSGLRLFKEKATKNLFVLVLLLTVALFVALIVLLYLKSLPILDKHSLGELLGQSKWQPWKQKFGFFPFIMGTVWVSALAMVFVLPVSLLSAIYLSEYASRRLNNTFKSVFDILAGIPSVVYGLWGMLLIVPFTKSLAALCGVPSSGYSLLAGAIVLAVMVLPIIIQITLDIFNAFPMDIRMAALSLGATRWQVVKKVLLKRSLSGISSAAILGMARVFGETMAVLMVAGNVARTPKTPFDAVYPLPALIANYYGEIMSIPLFDSAILFAALLLFLVVLLFNVLSNLLLLGIRHR